MVATSSLRLLPPEQPPKPSLSLSPAASAPAPFPMGNCSPSPCRKRPSPAGSPPSSSSAATGNGATTVSLYALARSPSVSLSVDPAIGEAERDGVVRVYGSDACPVAWRLRVALLYKAAAPLHFTPSEAAPFGRPVLRLSASDPELSGAADNLLRTVDTRFEGKPRIASPDRPLARSSLSAAAAEEVAEMVRLQHRSAERHLEGVAAKLAEMVKKGGKKAARAGGPRWWRTPRCGGSGSGTATPWR